MDGWVHPPFRFFNPPTIRPIYWILWHTTQACQLEMARNMRSPCSKLRTSPATPSQYLSLMPPQPCLQRIQWNPMGRWIHYKGLIRPASTRMLLIPRITMSGGCTLLLARLVEGVLQTEGTQTSVPKPHLGQGWFIVCPCGVKRTSVPPDTRRWEWGSHSIVSPRTIVQVSLLGYYKRRKQSFQSEVILRMIRLSFNKSRQSLGRSKGSQLNQVM